MRVVIIGAGNVATVLGKLIKKNGHNVLQVVSKRAVTGRVLAVELGSVFLEEGRAIDQSADIYIIAVTDSSIKEISEKYNLGDKLVVHTAGSVSKEILNNATSRYGVLYPLQSLRKECSLLPTTIPLLLDANTRESLVLLQNFAASISTTNSFANDAERLKLHVAAVLVSNFTNHLYTIAAEYCAGERVDFKLLLPLIEETAVRLHGHSPAEMMTGPAFRGDIKTIEKHLGLLESYPHIQKIYLRITEDILVS